MKNAGEICRHEPTLVTFIRGPLTAPIAKSSSIHARHDAGRPIKSRLRRLRRARRGAEALKWPDADRVSVSVPARDQRADVEKEIVSRRKETRGARVFGACVASSSASQFVDLSKASSKAVTTYRLHPLRSRHGSTGDISEIRCRRRCKLILN